MSINTVERQLRRNSQQLGRLKAELAVLEEQFGHFADEAQTTRIHSLVSETPISERTHQQAARHLEVIERQRDTLKLQICELEGRQDSLLDQINS